MSKVHTDYCILSKATFLQFIPGGEVFSAWEKHKGTEVRNGKVEELGFVVLELMLFHFTIFFMLCKNSKFKISSFWETNLAYVATSILLLLNTHSSKSSFWTFSHHHW